MPRPFWTIPLLAAAALGSTPRLAAAEPAADRMRADLFFLAGDACEGRGVKTEGINRAADYIAAQFKAAGLKPGGPDGSYFQPFRIAGAPKLGATNTLTFAGPGKTSVLRVGADFTPTGLSAVATLPPTPVVFAGYGITSEAHPEYDDYAGLDVKGKWVLVLRQAPRATAADPPFDPKKGSPHPALASKLDNAVKHGAAGVLFVNPRADDGADPLMEFGYAAGRDEGIPVLHVKRAAADDLLETAGTTLSRVQDRIDAKLIPVSRPLVGWTAAAGVSVTRPAIAARNVLGVADGAGPLAAETVVVGAHYDHLGRGDQAGSLAKDAKGQIHPGADDNASGTTGLIELARRFAAQPNRQGRRVVFAAFSGEEIDLLGSKHYCKEPPFPLETTAFMLNMDMIGRVVPASDDAGLVRLGVVAGGLAGGTLPGGVVERDRLVVYGTGTADGLDARVEAANKPLGFKLLKVPGGTGPSDHDSFYRKKIPVLFFFSGTHRDYHRPSDTPDKINLRGLAKVVDLVEALTAGLAGAADKPRYAVAAGGWEDPTDPAPKRSPGASGPKLGIMPGNYESAAGGVLVDDVSPGGAAEAGGVKAGDVIVEIGGRPVANIGGYMAAMGGQKAGRPVDVVVVRKDQKLTLKVTPK